MWSKMCFGSHVRCLLFWSDLNKTWLFWTDLRKLLKYQISWKSVQWEPSCSMRTDGRTDGQTVMTKLTVAFRKFAKAPKPVYLHFSHTLRLKQWLETRGQQTPGGPRLRSIAAASTWMGLEKWRNFTNILVPIVSNFFIWYHSSN